MTFLRPHDIKLSEDIIKLFKLDGVQPEKYGIITEAPVEKSPISFASPTLLVFSSRVINATRQPS